MKCKTCNSKFKENIHQLRLNKEWGYEKIEIWTKKQGERISAQAIAKHFTNHVYPYMKFSKEADEIAREYVDHAIEEDIDTINQIERHLRLLESTLGAILGSGKIQSSRMIKEIRETVTAIIDCLSKYEKIKKEYYPDREDITKEKLYEDFIKACEGIHTECLEIIVNRLQEMGYE